MPLTKRLKDAVVSYMGLQRELYLAQSAYVSAQLIYRKAKESTDRKIDEILKELKSCTAATTMYTPERVVEIDGKTYLITESPLDKSTENPSYIREITVER